MKRVYFTIGQGYMADGTPIRHHELLQWRIAAYKYIADVFGGATTVNITGAWISPTSQSLVRERSWGIEVFTDSHSAEKHTTVAQWLKAEFRQESVMIAVQSVDTLDFV